MNSALNLVLALLLIGLVCPLAAEEANLSEVFRLAQSLTGSVVTVGQGTNSCKTVEVLQGIRSSVECLFRCSSSGCAAAAFKDGVCRTVHVEPVLFRLARPECNTTFNGTSGEMVFVSQKINILWNITYNTYRNSSSGRTGSIQTLTVNETGCYRMEALGARGGSSNPAFSPVYTGGFGARIGGSFNLTAGTQLSLVIGQRGGDATQSYNHAASGGGGGTFVYRSSDNLLYLAAGGGGGGSIGYKGVNGSAGPNGTDSVGTASYVGYGGANGQPGSYGPSTRTYKGGLGAGWLGVAISRTRTCYGDRGGGISQGWVGGVAGHGNEGAVGGFGGGGGGSHQSGAAGGGGGFSGGAAGSWYPQAGGGGGSFCSGVGCSGESGGNSLSDSGLLLFGLIRPGSCA